jgi:RNA polymerase sigma factor (sigma-70 family)
MRKTAEAEMQIDTRPPSGDSAFQGSFPADGLLLEQFAKEGNQQAFEALMERHGPYLLGLCRRLTHYTQDAEDVFQACFLELVHKASAIRYGGSVAGWLQTVAVRLSHKARVRRLSQARRERAGAKPEAVSPDDVTWREACQILEEELARLPAELRSPMVLCFFEGQTQDEAARSLDVNPRTLKDRLQRGRELLGQRLVRRGVTLAVLGTLLSGGSAHAAVSTALGQTTLHGATAIATKTPLVGVVSPAVLSLTGSAAWLTGWSLLAVVWLGLVLTSGIGVAIWGSSSSGSHSKVMHTVRRSFRDRQFDAGFFQWSGPRPQRFITREDEGLRITLPAKNGPGQPIGIQLRRPVRGDFELEATVEWLQVPRPAKGFGGGITVYFFLDSAHQDGVWFGKMLDPNDGPVYAVGRRWLQGEERKDDFVKTIPSRSEAGLARLRAVRRGTTFSIYGADGGDGEFQSLGDFEIGADDVSIVRFAVDPAWSPSAAIDARLVEVMISAEEAVGHGR